MSIHKTLKDANMTKGGSTPGSFVHSLPLLTLIKQLHTGSTPGQCLYCLRLWTPVWLGTMADGRDLWGQHLVWALCWQ